MIQAPVRRRPGGTAAAAHRSVTKKLLLSLAALGTAASIAGLGTYAAFTSTTSASQDVTTGTVTIALGTASTANNRLTVSASDVAPGDTIERAVTLTNSGSLDLASVNLTTSATSTSLLDTDATNGLQMVIEKCDAGWTESGPPYTYTCSGTTTSVLATRPVVGSALALSGLNATTAGGSDSLRVKLTLPSTAGNTFQGLSSTIQYSFTATQRAATSK